MERATPLLALHRELGAKLTEFGGWDMPLQYTGIVAEHNAVRGSCGLFDVSHLGKLRLGPGSGAALQQTVTCDVDALEVGRASYALVLTDDAGCIDDVFVYRMALDEWLVVPNAANVGAVADALRASGAEPVDEWDRYAILALQGPDSFDLFEKAFPDTGATELALHRWTDMDFWGSHGVVARTGYTGERGFELYVPSSVSERAARVFLDLGVTPVGLGARDTLRLEMGYALYGHEIDLDTNPLEAGLAWAVKWDAPFRGRDALEKVRETGPARKLFGAKLVDRGVPRQGYEVHRDGEPIGEVVSGNHSPTLGVGIAMAYAPTQLVPEVGARVSIEARGRMLQAEVAAPPFIEKGR
jgi:aminomethyltransferase